MKFRHEWKFNISDCERAVVNNKINKVLMCDEHIKNGDTYYVHSLYFDDYFNSCMKDNDAGISKKYKWRIRYYNDNFDYICLEKKEKSNSLSRKRVCQLSKDQYTDIVNDEIHKVFWNTDNKLLKEFCYDILTKMFRPKIIVDYERTAFVEKISNIRITFDKNISVSKEIEKFFDGGYTKIPIQSINDNIMEVKFDDILPSHLKLATNINNLKQINYSKYYLGRNFIERN